MKPALLALCLLCPSLAGAATWAYTFEDAVPHHVAQQIGTVTGNGFTITFGPLWRRAVDEDACTPPNGCVLPLNQGELGPWGNFANEPSGTCGAYVLPGQDADGKVYVSPAIRTLSFRYSGTHDPWCDDQWCYNGLYSLPILVQAFRPGGSYPPVASVEFSEPGDTWETGCAGDPTGDQCTWPTATLTFSEPVGQFHVGVSWAALVPFYIDNMVFTSDDCQHPPCEFESAHQDRETPARRASWGSLKLRYR